MFNESIDVELKSYSVKISINQKVFYWTGMFAIHN